ncbi:centromere protein J [Thecamonas trahens ATCC 50062]|uniref:Centromere protein J n=1 Tax=Thecamonas trahens ATCC 50062 TaxID=461836 RepID=A0A0L0DKP4_THETB|nr:centromere protein J [Thecamonas trahens ATCC 50062]KNC52805.1 centromere protein J [Thecamonas trahens ATCC 50062]|eukprot:XP_013755114.1 centromere protein J [Thecamonas trahens ATCC 50062]
MLLGRRPFLKKGSRPLSAGMGSSKGKRRKRRSSPPSSPPQNGRQASRSPPRSPQPRTQPPASPGSGLGLYDDPYADDNELYFADDAPSAAAEENQARRYFDDVPEGGHMGDDEWAEARRREKEELDEFTALEADIMAESERQMAQRSQLQSAPRQPAHYDPPAAAAHYDDAYDRASALFDDDEEWNEPEYPPQPSHSPPRSRDPPHNHSSPEASPPRSALVQARFGAAAPPPRAHPHPNPHQHDADEPMSAEIREKLELLELEIANFKEENRKIRAVRSEKELALQRLRMDVTEFEKQKAEAEAEFEDYKRREKMDLARQRERLEKMHRSLASMPSKADRREIDELNEALAHARAAARDREAKLKSALERTKSKLESSEARVADLAHQVQVISDERLDAWDQLDAIKSQSASTDRELEVLRTKATRYSRELNTKDDEIAEKVRELDAKDDLIADLHAKVRELEARLRRSTASSATHPPSRSSPLADDPHDARSVRFQDQVQRFYYTPPQAAAGASAKPAHTSPSPSPSPTSASSSSPYFFSESGDDIDRALEATTKPAHQASPAAHPPPPDADDDERPVEVIQHDNGKVEEVFASGWRRVRFPNGTQKQIRGDHVVVLFGNGDIRESFPAPDKREVYYYAQAKTRHTSYDDGLEVFEFGTTGQVEKHYPSGKKEIIFQDSTTKTVMPSGEEVTRFPDGTTQRVAADGVRTISFPSGDREVHEKDGTKRRTCADGVVRTVFPDGRQETRYPSGRIRVKSPSGRVISDSH